VAAEDRRRAQHPVRGARQVTAIEVVVFVILLLIFLRVFGVV
jgi:hypothetical protein